MINIEKDFFKDRSIEAQKIEEITVGKFAFICEKKNQRSAKEMKDLTFGKIVRVLTKHSHPRGIKVEMNVYSLCNDNIYRKSNKFAIGRVTYLVDNGIILKNN